MAVSSVDLIINAVKAVNPLRQVSKESKKLGQSISRTQRAMRNLGVVGARATKKLKDGFNRATRGAQALAQKVGGLKSALIGLGLGAVTKSFVNQAAQFSQTQIRLRALAGEYGEYDRVQELIAKNAKTFNLSLAESASQFADIFARLRPVGKSLDEIQTTFEGFNAVAIVSGTSAVAASAAFLQLSQALGSGRLQGDEFRSISEQLPGILKLVADQMQVNVEDLKKLGSEGAITADILINALAKGFDKNADKIAAILEQSPAAKFKAFKNATSELSTAIGTELLPVITPLAEKATDLLKQVGGMPTPLKQAAGGILLLGVAAAIALPAIGGLATTLSVMGVAQIVALGKIAVALAAVGGTGALIVELSKSVTEFQDLIDTGSVKDLEKEATRLEKAIEGLDKTAIVGGKNLEGMGQSASVASQELTDLESKLKRVRTAITQRVDTQPEQGAFDFAKIQAAIEAAKPKKIKRKKDLGGKEEEEKKKHMQEITQLINTQSSAQASLVDKRREENNHLRATLNHGEKFADFTREVTDLVKNGGLSFTEAFDLVNAGRLVEDQIDKQEELANAQQKAADELKEKYKQVGDAIKSKVTDSIIAAIDGTKSLGESAMGILKDLANQFLRSGISQLFGAVGTMGPSGGLLSMLFGGGRASGGTVKGSTSYIVGERGPELFTPGRSGSIAPNSAIGGANVTVNVDASGSNVQGDQPDAKALGSAIGAAVQAELIKQKRPGGLLSA